MQPLQIRIDDAHTVSGLWSDAAATATLVLAHGAGAGMQHPFMADMATLLRERGIATLRINFPYMEAGSKRPDRPPLAQAAVRAAVDRARGLAPDRPLFAGGKSFGGRMTSQAQASAPLPAVQGLVFLGFPLHPANKPSTERAAHLAQINVPMQFVQGTRDALADLALLAPTVERLGAARLCRIEGADHSFAVPAKMGRPRAEILAQIADEVSAFTRGAEPSELQDPD